MTNHPAGSATGFDLDALEQLAREYIAAQEVDRPSNVELNALKRRISARLDAKTVLALIALARATPQHPEALADGATIYQEALTHAAFYVHDHCQQGKEHAQIICDLKIPERYTKASAATPQHSVTEQALRDGYTGSTMVSDFAGPKITLRYDTTAQADAAHATLCKMIDAKPLPSTAATQPEQALPSMLEGAWTQEVIAKARATLAIPASTAGGETICTDGGMCGVGGYCRACPYTAASEQQAGADDLPELPHPAISHGSRDFFSAGQMFDYARAAMATPATSKENS